MLDIQESVRELYEGNKWDTASELIIIAMQQEELGELCARFLAEHPDYEKNPHDTFSIPDCVGDLGLQLLAFCNLTGLSFESCVAESIKERRK